MLHLLVVSLLALLLLAVASAYSSILSPSTVFISGFLLCAISADFAARMWGFQLSPVTYWVIVGGLLVFWLFATVTQLVFRRLRPAVYTAGQRFSVAVPREIGVTQASLWILAIFQIIVFGLSAKAIVDLYPSGTFFESLAAYNDAGKFSNQPVESLPSFVSALRAIASALSYLLSYLLAESLALRRWRSLPLLLVNAVLAMGVGLQTGGRNGMIAFIVYTLVCYVFLEERSSGRPMRVTLSKVFLVSLLSLSIILVFQPLLSLVGRQSETNPVQYFAMYLGAQIPNLDSFLTDGIATETSIWGSQTFVTSINWFGERMGIADLVYQPDLPFQFRDDIILGNVYTTFYPYLYDFGIWGLVMCVAIMAVLSQSIFEIAKRSSPQTFWFWTVMYALVANTLFMSFFSNKFYEFFLSVSMIPRVALLLILYGIYSRSVKSKETPRSWENIVEPSS